jgi:DNA-binding transcriptional regulator LsrR (DeoR family)
VIRFDAEGLQRTQIARRTGIGVASVYRVLADAKKLDAGRAIQV